MLLDRGYLICIRRALQQPGSPLVVMTKNGNYTHNPDESLLVVDGPRTIIIQPTESPGVHMAQHTLS